MVFQINESDYESIVKQIRDKEFNNEIERREKEYELDKENAGIASGSKLDSIIQQIAAFIEGDYSRKIFDYYSEQDYY